MQEEEEIVGKVLRRWISFGDLFVLVSAILAIGVMWGSLSKDLDAVRDDVALLMQQQRSMTPQAATEIASIRQKDMAQDEQLRELKEELRSSRREILDGLARLESQLDEHSGKR